MTTAIARVPAPLGKRHARAFREASGRMSGALTSLAQAPLFCEPRLRRIGPAKVDAFHIGEGYGFALLERVRMAGASPSTTARGEANKPAPYPGRRSIATCGTWSRIS